MNNSIPRIIGSSVLAATLCTFGLTSAQEKEGQPSNLNAPAQASSKDPVQERGKVIKNDKYPIRCRWAREGQEPIAGTWEQRERYFAFGVKKDDVMLLTIPEQLGTGQMWYAELPRGSEKFVRLVNLGHEGKESKPGAKGSHLFLIEIKKDIPKDRLTGFGIPVRFELKLVNAKPTDEREIIFTSYTPFDSSGK